MPRKIRKKTDRVGVPVPRDASGKWLPGHCANPGGRTPESFDLAARARAHGPRMLEYLVSVVDGAELEAKVADKIKAACEVLHRGFGRPPQELQVNGVDTAEDGRPKIIVEHVHVTRSA